MSIRPNRGTRSTSIPRPWRSALVVALLAAAASAVAQTQASGSEKAPPLSSTTTSKFGAKVSELQIVDQKTGAGAEAVSGKAVVVHYTGWLYDPAAPDGHGQKFDSSLDRNVPFGFFLGGKCAGDLEESTNGPFDRCCAVDSDGWGSFGCVR